MNDDLGNIVAIVPLNGVIIRLSNIWIGNQTSQIMQMTVKIVFLLMTILGIMVLLHGMTVTVIGHSDMFAKFIKKVRDPRT